VNTNTRRVFVLCFLIVGFLCAPSRSAAQPTYKLDVKPHLKPLATLTVKDGKLTRTAIVDDPGFRLQYHFKDGKSSTVMNARAGTTLAIPQNTPGTYTVVLEMFYPAYKGGTGQKGEFKPVSNVIQFRVEAGARPTDPVKVVLVEPPKPALPPAGKPALVIQCGKGSGKQQDELLSRGFGYKLLQGTAFDGWAKTATRTHCWYDARQVRFELSVPRGTTGMLRLLFVDADGLKRKQRAIVLGKVRGEFENFGGVGKTLEVALTAADTRAGKIEVTLENLNATANAVVSAVEIIPAPR
jgi:hypothetical protein